MKATKAPSKASSGFSPAGSEGAGSVRPRDPCFEDVFRPFQAILGSAQ